ncbi:hypothetical protein F4820DRAFT_66664 [Hypoxylon rubiginosum]|uniref:Uncharacterized protein n=1 Tax=Hypoxylon rubiginosum TaxID=110542 RepID=A0ACB9YQH8_9PEZI|nr:hypothetical protein F4820DRAFT_66664 [Hypoxylon rubiginosum]
MGVRRAARRRGLPILLTSANAAMSPARLRVFVKASMSKPRVLALLSMNARWPSPSRRRRCRAISCPTLRGRLPPTRYLISSRVAREPSGDHGITLIDTALPIQAAEYFLGGDSRVSHVFPIIFDVVGMLGPTVSVEGYCYPFRPMMIPYATAASRVQGFL